MSEAVASCPRCGAERRFHESVPYRPKPRRPLRTDWFWYCAPCGQVWLGWTIALETAR